MGCRSFVQLAVFVDLGIFLINVKWSDSFQEDLIILHIH